MTLNSPLKDEYLNMVRVEYGLLDPIIALELFLNGSLSLRAFIKSLRWEFAAYDYVFFEPNEVELRQKLTNLILSFLSGELNEEEFYEELRQYT